jgi:hypothetical protein
MLRNITEAPGSVDVDAIALAVAEIIPEAPTPPTLTVLEIGPLVGANLYTLITGTVGYRIVMQGFIVSSSNKQTTVQWRSASTRIGGSHDIDVATPVSVSPGADAYVCNPDESLVLSSSDGSSSLNVTIFYYSKATT